MYFVPSALQKRKNPDATVFQTFEINIQDVFWCSFLLLSLILTVLSDCLNTRRFRKQVTMCVVCSLKWNMLLILEILRNLRKIMRQITKRRKNGSFRAQCLHPESDLKEDGLRSCLVYMYQVRVSPSEFKIVGKTLWKYVSFPFEVRRDINHDTCNI